MENNSDQQFTTWEPQPHWLLLLPSRLPEKHGSIFIPESIAKKSNSGICIKAGPHYGDEQEFLGKEITFPNHSEYVVEDSDTGFLLYLIHVDKAIMMRTPPKDIDRASRVKGEGLSFETITSSRNS